MDPPKFTAAELDAIQRHHEHLLQACQRTLGRLRRIPRNRRPNFVSGQIDYWTHAEKAFRWSLAIAQQRKPTDARVTNGDIPEDSGGTVQGG